MHDDVPEEELGPRSLPATNWAEVHTIANGLRDVPIDVLVRGRIDSEYDLPPIGKCGRRGCEQEHGWGYIFAIPGKRYVNIGHCCADRYASDAMRLIKSAYKDWRSEQARAASIQAMISEAEQKAVWLESIKPEAVRGTELKNSFLRQFRGPLERDILKRADERRPRVERQVSISIKARDAQRAMLQGGRSDVLAENIRVSRFEVRHLGDLKGLDLFRRQGDPVSQWMRFRRLVDVILEAAAKPQDLEGMSQLDRARRDFGSLSNNLAVSLKAARDFFTERNLDLVKSMQPVRGEGIERIVVVGSAIQILRNSR